MNNVDFVNNVTMRICSNLDINLALVEVVDYMKDFIPIDEVYIDVLNEKHHEIKRLASATIHGEKCDKHSILIPEQLNFREFLKKLGEDVWVMEANSLDNIPEADSATSEFLSRLKLAGSSDLILKLELTDGILAFLIFRSYKEKIYTDKHKELLRSISVPFSLAVSNALVHLKLQSKYRRLSNEITGSINNEFIGQSASVKKVLDQISQVSVLNSTVLIHGETGVGKEIVANYIHTNSNYKNGPFIKVNCGSIPESLIDSELFGHEKGAFTGANSLQVGKLERANKGTLFLDEIGELPIVVQARLLRFLQFKELERLGGKKTINLDVRIVTATNRNLENMVKKGHFREDLWYRLCVFPIEIPPLKERREDIPLLVEYLISTKARKLGLKKCPLVPSSLMNKLQNYDWPGNVREMENVIERELILNHDKKLLFNCILGSQPNENVNDATNEDKFTDIIHDLDTVIKNHINKVLKYTSGKISGAGGAAEVLGVHPNTLRNKMIKLDMLK